MNTTPNPSSILQTAFGFWGSKVLLTAVEVGSVHDARRSSAHRG